MVSAPGKQRFRLDLNLLRMRTGLEKPLQRLFCHDKPFGIGLFKQLKIGGSGFHARPFGLGVPAHADLEH